MNIGVIGYGTRANRVFGMIQEHDRNIKLKAITDIRVEQVKETLKENEINTNSTAFYNNADEMLDAERLDGVLIGTRCSLHTHMALKVLKRNLPLFLEKPVATNMDDLLRLKAAGEISKSSVVVSFPLRATPLVKLVKEIIDSGKLGKIEHVQAINNVPYGGVYYHRWYRDEKETGGLFLQKATHDLDYINYLLGLRPITICAMKSKQIFKGNRPAELYCKDCDENNTCPEGLIKRPLSKNEKADSTMCCFAKDTGNEDSGSAIIKYETGMHVSYSQNFFARRSAALRGARLLGYKGTLEFDWVKNELKIFMHNATGVETHSIDKASLIGVHDGGDYVLTKNFIQVIKGEEESVAPLEAGLLSTLMCLKARESAETETFQSISW